MTTNESISRLLGGEPLEVAHMPMDRRVFVALAANRYDLLPKSIADPVHAWLKLNASQQHVVCIYRGWNPPSTDIHERQRIATEQSIEWLIGNLHGCMNNSPIADEINELLTRLSKFRLHFESAHLMREAQVEWPRGGVQ